MNRFTEKLVLLYRFLISPTFVISCLVVIGAFLRTRYLFTRSLWLDEAKLFWIAQGTVAEVLVKNAASNSAPPLFALITHLVSKAGDSEAILRSTSLIAGVLSIPAMYILTRNNVGIYAGYFSAFLVTVSVNLIGYSQELREYSLTFLLTLSTLLLFQRFIKKPGLGNWLFITVVLALGILTQYGFALFALSLNFIFLIFLVSDHIIHERKTLLSGWILTQIILLGVIVIVYRLSLADQLVGGGFAGDSYLRNAYWDGSFKSFIRLGIYNTYQLFRFATLHPVISVIFGCLALLYIFSPQRSMVPLFVLAAPLVVNFVAALLRLYPYTGTRQCIYLAPMIILFLSTGFHFLITTLTMSKMKINSYILVTTLLALIAVYGLGVLPIAKGQVLGTLTVENIKPLVGIISESFEDHDRIYVGCRAEPAFRYYYHVNQDKWVIRQGNTFDEYSAQLKKTLAEPGRVWLLFSHCNNFEMERIITSTSAVRSPELIASTNGAWLFFVK